MRRLKEFKELEELEMKSNSFGRGRQWHLTAAAVGGHVCARLRVHGVFSHAHTSMNAVPAWSFANAASKSMGHAEKTGRIHRRALSLDQAALLVVMHAPGATAASWARYRPRRVQSMFYAVRLY